MPTTNYIWDELNDSVLMTRDSNDHTTIVYTNKPGQFAALTSEREGSQSQGYSFDTDGSTRQLSGSTGPVTETHVYDVSGNMAQGTGTSVVPYHVPGWEGYQYDRELAAFYIRTRHYSPVLARWLCQDPVWTSQDPVVGRKIEESLALILALTRKTDRREMMSGAGASRFLGRTFAEILDLNGPRLGSTRLRVSFTRAKQSFAKKGIASSRDILRAFDSLTASQQRVALSVFSHLRYTHAVPLLFRLLKDGGALCNLASIALGSIGGDRTAQRLCNITLGSPNEAARACAIPVLSHT